MKNRKLIEYLADFSLVTISLIWGSTFIVTKKIVEIFDPITFIFLRFAVATILLMIICIPLYKKMNRILLRDGVILGFTLFIIFFFQTLALKMATATEVGFLTGLYVLFVPVLSAVFLKKYPHIFSWLGVVLSTAGMVMISYRADIGISVGQIFGIINAFFIGVQILLTDVYSRKHNVVLLTLLQIGTVCVCSGAYSYMFGTNQLEIMDNSYVIFAILALGVFATVVCFFLQTAMQKYTTPTKAAIMFTLEPISSGFFSFLIGGEILSGRQYVGAALIIFAILVAEVGTAMRHARVKEPVSL